MAETLIAGIGSPHGADRLGWAVIEALQERTLPGETRLLACRLPSELTPLLLEVPRAIVIDAMLGAGPAGTLHELSLADLPQSTLRLSSHGLGLVDAVLLAAVLGMPAGCLTVLAMDVARPGAELEEVWVARLCERVSSLLQRAA